MRSGVPIGMRACCGLLLALLLAACGGGSQFTAFMPPPPASLRADLWFGYYLTFDNQNEETKDHVNLVHESGWFGVDQTIASMRQHGKPTMLNLQNQAYIYGKHTVPRPDLDARVGATFDALKAAGVLRQVVALYPIDEPENIGLNEEAVTATNAAIRATAARFPELAGVKLAVIYTNKNILPGFASYDWIGMDDYDFGPGILNGAEWQTIMKRLGPTQGAFIVPGGGSPWKADPEAFRRYAHSTPKVVGILPFMWSARRGDGDWPGIGTNGMAESYRAVGLEIVGGAASPQIQRDAP